MRVDLETAFVLHTRNFTDSRILVELFTSEHGRISVVARTGRNGGKNSGKKGGRFGLLRSFQPLLVSWQGNSDLKSLVHTESDGSGIALKGNALYCGIYLNELLLRVVAVADPQPRLFQTYHNAIVQLERGEAMEPVLRGFELDLLTELGYGIPFDVDAESGEPIEADTDYVFAAASGFTALSSDSLSTGPLGARPTSIAGARNIFRGDRILAISRREFDDALVRTAAKSLCRLALEPLLGSKPLKSRELFATVKPR